MSNPTGGLFDINYKDIVANNHEFIVSIEELEYEKKFIEGICKSVAWQRGFALQAYDLYRALEAYTGSTWRTRWYWIKSEWYVIKGEIFTKQ